MSVVHPVCAAGAAPKPIDTLDGHLLVAHGASVSEIAARRDPATRFLTMCVLPAGWLHGCERTAGSRP